jgi:DNA-binding response OmpR family regulator
MNPQKKILLVEDEAVVARLYSEQLMAAGFLVDVASQGTQGFQLLTTNPYDLVLLDIMLPGMNGLQILQQWRAKSPTATTPVLLLTNLGQDEIIKQAFDLGATGYLIKSAYTPQQVVVEVQNTLTSHQNPPTQQ